MNQTGRSDARQEAHKLDDVMARHRDEERREALRALLMQPLMTAGHPAFAAVRRHADELREWFTHQTGWLLHIERDCARLYKRPANLQDASRGAPDFERRHYVLFCLACAALERADAQITLRDLGDKLLILAADPELRQRGFAFTLEAVHERRELVAVCRYLLGLGVLHRVAGDEDAFVAGANKGDALYDVQRRVLASMLAASRGPSTWPADGAPTTLDQRLAALVEEYAADSEEGHKNVMRQHLARRLLDDPVVYFTDLDDDMRLYFQRQRSQLANRLCEAVGLVAEQRAEGLALVDESGELTDASMPAEGTASHITLLVAEFLAAANHKKPERWIAESEVAGFIKKATPEYGKYWRKSAREPGAERELAQDALRKLAMLRLIARRAAGEAQDGKDGAEIGATPAAVQALPALARFALGAPVLKARKPAAKPGTPNDQADSGGKPQGNLF